MITAVVQTIGDVFHKTGPTWALYWRGGSLIRSLLLGIAFLCLAAGQVPAQDAGAGEQVFVQCRACHQVGETAKNGIGPHLNGIFGRRAGSVEGYAYSPALKNSGIIWDETTFTDYTRDPKAKVPGTKMVYAGLKDEQRMTRLPQFGLATR